MSAEPFDPAFQLEVLVQGFPGKSVCHGPLGWSTIALVRDGERTIVVDTGSFNHRHAIYAGLPDYRFSVSVNSSRSKGLARKSSAPV